MYLRNPKISNENFYKKNELFEKLVFMAFSKWNSKRGQSVFCKGAIFLKKNIRPGYDCLVLKTTNEFRFF